MSSGKRKRATEPVLDAPSKVPKSKAFPPAHLYHLAFKANLPSIQQHGLMSTERLLQHLHLPDSQCKAILSEHRPKHVELPNGIVIRDQSPMPPSALAKVLPDGCAPADWYRLMNSFVFLWPSRERVERHRAAHGGAELVLLVLDADKLMADLGEQMCMSPINSGFALRKAAARSPSTFVPYLQYLRSGWASADDGSSRARSAPVVEVVIKGGMPLAPYLVRVEGIDE